MGNNPRRIPTGRAPTVLQMDRDTAEREAQRLAAAHPDKRFAIFAAVSVAKVVTLPTHTTLSGEEIGNRQVPLLLDFADSATAADLEIPF
mgnify:FL=1